MKTHTTPASLLQSQVQRFRDFEGTQIQLHEEMVAAAREDHIELTSGGISTRTLRALGHPFAREGDLMRGAPKAARLALGIKGVMPVLPINRQTRELQESLTVEGPIGSDREYRMGFKAAHAKFVLKPGGTVTMVDRGFFAELKKRNKARLHGQLLRARDIQARS